MKRPTDDSTKLDGGSREEQEAERLRAGVAALTGVDVNDLVLPELGWSSQEELRIERLAQKKCQKAVAKVVLWGAIIAVVAVLVRWLGFDKGEDEVAGTHNIFAAWHDISRIIGDLILLASIAVLGFAGWKALKNKWGKK